MPSLRVLIVQVDDPASETMTELASFDLPTPDPATLQPAAALDDLETTTLTTGMAVCRRLLQARCDLLDAALAAQYRQQTTTPVQADGYEPLTLLSRFGRVPLRRRQLYHPATTTHVVPGNAVLRVQEGALTTRGLQEWACLLPQELPFAAVERLLGWQAQEADVLSAGTVRTLVTRHGQLIHQAEQAEAATLLERSAPGALVPVLVPPDRPRRRSAWPAELNAAVEAALAAEPIRPPAGVSWADWERVLAARRAETTTPIEDLRHLGPQLGANDVLLTSDEVLTPKADGTGRWELRTATLMTPDGYRYLSGTGTAFLQTLLALTLVTVGHERTLLLLSDGARWIRTFFSDQLAHLPGATHLLDWFHLEQTCRDLSSRICRGKEEKHIFLRRLHRRLWAGRVDRAVAWLEQYRPQSRNPAVLDDLIGYLQARTAWIPNYRQRRRERHSIGSGHVEQANDLIVARRQKRKGMGWSLDTSDSLAALRTLLLNGGWDRYWVQGEVLPLVKPAVA